MVKQSQRDELVIVITTEVNRKVADALAKEILNRKLAACVSLRDIRSFFWWDDELEEADEVQLLIKTMKSHLNILMKTIYYLHSYQNPEIIYWACSSRDKYKEWVENNLLRL